MEIKHLGRAGSFGWSVVLPVVLGASVLTSCGGATTSGASVSTVNLDATNYIVKDPVTTTTPEADDGTTDGSQVYIVQAGDYAILVADKFGVPLEDLLNFNGWASGNEFPFPGEEVLIPPGGKVLGADSSTATETADTDTDTDTATDTDTETATGDTIPDTGSNCEPGSYTIEEADNARTKVAAKFDVTVEALDAANAGTAGYSAFYPGLKIVIPAKADC